MVVPGRFVYSGDEGSMVYEGRHRFKHRHDGIKYGRGCFSGRDEGLLGFMVFV